VTLSAPTVSAVLRRSGLLPASSTREGIHVTPNGPDEVAVIADCESSLLANDLSAQALKSVRAAGYRVRVPADENLTFYVTGRP
jgi:hypothetical protein